MKPVRQLISLYLAVVVVVGLAAVVRDQVRSSDGPSDSSSVAADPTSAPADPASSPPVAASDPVPYDQLTPSPEDAVDDRPDLYDDECQVGVDAYQPVGCVYGTPARDATATIAVVGDSKAGQWTTALQDLAETRGWRIVIYTKSACAAVAVPLSRDGGEYRSCTRFNRRVRQELTKHPVDLILSGSSDDNALVTRLRRGETPARARLTTFVRGQKRLWGGWIKAGNRVAVISDTPRPVADGQTFDVATCLQEHRDDFGACTYGRRAGIAVSGRRGQKRAIDEAHGVDVSAALLGRPVRGADRAKLVWIDPVRLICPGSTCRPNSGDILIYREGSHLTRTYVESLTDRIGDVMTALGLP